MSAPHWNLMSLYWIVIWFLIGFGIPEGIALATGHPENTLSEQVWHLEGLTSRNDAVFANPFSWSIPHFLVTSLVIWLAAHFIFHVWHSM